MENHLEKRILRLLKKEKLPLMIGEISKKLGTDRTTVRFRLIKLTAEGKIKEKKMGTAKTYYIPENSEKK